MPYGLQNSKHFVITMGLERFYAKSLIAVFSFFFILFISLSLSLFFIYMSTICTFRAAFVNVWVCKRNARNERMCVLWLCHTRGFSLALIVVEVFSIHALKCSFSQVHLLGDCNLNSLRTTRYMWLSGQEWSQGATNGIFCLAINFISHCE